MKSQPNYSQFELKINSKSAIFEPNSNQIDNKIDNKIELFLNQIDQNGPHFE